MKSIIRWQGLVAFFVIFGSLAAIIVLFLDTWIRLGAQAGLGKATGAEVNIGSVSHTWSPFGVTLNELQFTDPKAPTTNQMQADTVSAKIELAPLLLRKLIISDLIVEGTQFATQRDSKGEVYVDVEDDTTDAKNLFGDAIKPPSVDEILAKSPLKTTQAVEDTQAVIARHEDKLKAQFEALPSKQVLADYQARAKALSEVDYKNPAALAKAKQDFDQLKKDVLADKQKITDFKDSVQQAKAELGPQLQTLKNAPSQDYEQLKAIAAGDQDAIQDVTQLVFGEQAAKWSKYVLAAFDVIAPMLNNQAEQTEENKGVEGQWLAFDDTSGLPDLWIKQAKISVTYQGESVASKWTDITHQHDLIGKATVFSIDSSASALWQSLALNGDFWLNDLGLKAQQSWRLAGLKLSDMPLANIDKLSSELQQGLLSSNGGLDIVNNQLSGKGIVDLSQLAIQASGDNKLTNAIANTLNQLKTLQLDTDIGGTLGDLDLNISSDLAKQIGSALISSVTPEQQQKLDDLKAKLNAKTSGLLGDTDGALGQWSEWEKLAEGDVSSLNKVLEAQLNNAIDKQKDKIKGKLFEKLLG